MKTGGGWAGLEAAGGTENQEENRLPGAGDEEGGQQPARPRPRALRAGQPGCLCRVPRHPAGVGPGGCCEGGRGGQDEAGPWAVLGVSPLRGRPLRQRGRPTELIRPPRASGRAGPLGCPPRPPAGGRRRRRPGLPFRPCAAFPALLAAVQLRALPPAAPLWVPEAFSAIQMEMPRGWRMETLFAA